MLAAVFGIFAEVFVMGDLAVGFGSNVCLAGGWAHGGKDADFLHPAGRNTLHFLIEGIEQKEIAALHAVDVQVGFFIIADFIHHPVIHNKCRDEGKARQHGQNGNQRRGHIFPPEKEHQHKAEEEDEQGYADIAAAVIIPADTPAGFFHAFLIAQAFCGGKDVVAVENLHYFPLTLACRADLISSLGWMRAMRWPPEVL